MRVIVADDAILARAGISALLTEAGCEVVGVAGDGVEALRLVREHDPDVAVIDIRMPPTHTNEGLVAAQQIRERCPHVAVLVLSQYVEPSYALQLISTYPERLGYLLKERVINGEALAETLHRLAAGECVIDPTIVAQLMRRRRRVDPLDRLTTRERDVLDLIAQGHSNTGIARLLTISERTVETHATQVFMKLNLTENAQINRRVLAVLTLLTRSE